MKKVSEIIAFVDCFAFISQTGSTEITLRTMSKMLGACSGRWRFKQNKIKQTKIFLLSWFVIGMRFVFACVVFNQITF